MGKRPFADAGIAPLGFGQHIYMHRPQIQSRACQAVRGLLLHGIQRERLEVKGWELLISRDLDGVGKQGTGKQWETPDPRNS